jgi:hypothetical protein
MSQEIITREDLDQFRIALVRDIQIMLVRHIPVSTKPLLKNSEVKKLLSLSESKLQRLRIQGILSSRKIGGVHYYRYSDIEQMISHPQ